MWVVVKIMVPFWVPIIIRHLLFRVPKKGTIILTTTHVSCQGVYWLRSVGGTVVGFGVGMRQMSFVDSQRAVSRVHVRLGFRVCGLESLRFRALS